MKKEMAANDMTMSGEMNIHRHSLLFRRSPVPAQSSPEPARSSLPCIPYRRRARPARPVSSDEEADSRSQRAPTLAPSTIKTHAGRTIRAAKDQDVFAYLSSEEDEGDDDEVCNFGDSLGDLNLALHGARSKKHPCLELLGSEHAAMELVTENPMIQHTLQSCAEESALALALQTLERIHASNSEESCIDVMMLSSPPAAKRSLSDLEVTSCSDMCVIGDKVHSDAVLAAKRARCGELQRLHSQMDAPDNNISPHSPHASFDNAPHVSAHGTDEVHVSTISAMLSPPTLSLHRVRAQREAAEYRRAVRKQLQCAAVSARSTGASCKVGLFGGASKVGGMVWGLYATPWDMLNGEVLSGDEEEEETCSERRSKLTMQTRALYHEV